MYDVPVEYVSAFAHGIKCKSVLYVEFKESGDSFQHAGYCTVLICPLYDGVECLIF